MTYYERRLPHWFPKAKTLFVTWRLHGSLPTSAQARVLARVQQRISRAAKARGQECPRHVAPSAGERFLAIDQELDRSRYGPKCLVDPRVASAVICVLRRGDTELGHYRLAAFVLMPNHVHILIEPRTDVTRALKGVKGTAARAANRILGRVGQRFWQEESFDHWVRSSAEFEKIRTYIERNPVAAGLALRPEEWPWSSGSCRRGRQ